jgi:hypothetical protein
MRPADAEEAGTISSGFRARTLFEVVTEAALVVVVIPGLVVHASHSVVSAPLVTLWVTTVAAVFAWLAIRCRRLGLVVSSGGLVVRNPWRTYRLEWADVTGFVDGRIRLMQNQYQS